MIHNLDIWEIKGYLLEGLLAKASAITVVHCIDFELKLLGNNFEEVGVRFHAYVHEVRKVAALRLNEIWYNLWIELFDKEPQLNVVQGKDALVHVRFSKTFSIKITLSVEIETKHSLFVVLSWQKHSGQYKRSKNTIAAVNTNANIDFHPLEWILLAAFEALETFINLFCHTRFLNEIKN